MPMAEVQRESRRSLLTRVGPDALATVVLVATLFVVWLQIRDLFPQVEFLDWISGNPPTLDALSDAIDPIVSFAGTYHARSLSLLYSAGIGKACGTGITCINTLAFLPVVVMSAAMYVAGRLLRLPASAAAAVVLVLLISEPTFLVLTWQATMHDRLGGAATFLVLIAVLLGVRLVRDGWLSTIAWSVGLAALGLATLNTKESAWVALPLMATAPFLVSTTRRQALRSARMVVLPLVVMIAHAAIQYASVADDPHISKGAPLDNIRTLTDFAVPGGWVVGLLIVLASALGVVVVSWRARWRGEVAANARIVAWVGIAAACGWAIPLRTEFPSAFYMFVPLALAALAVALALRTIFLAVRSRQRRAARWVGLAVGLALTALFVVGSVTSRFEPYDGTLALSDSFRAGLDESIAIRAAHPDRRIQFSAPPEAFNAYRFTTGNPAANFWRMAGAPWRALDATYGISVVNDPAACGDAVTLIVRLDARLRPVGTCPR